MCEEIVRHDRGALCALAFAAGGVGQLGVALRTTDDGVIRRRRS